MKIKWKFFLSTVSIFAILFTLGSYLMINTSFETSYNQFLERVMQQNYMNRIVLSTYYNYSRDNLKTTEEILQLSAKELSGQQKEETEKFRILGAEGQTIYSNVQSWNNNEFYKNAKSGKIVWQLFKIDDGYFIQTVNELGIENKEYYMESYYDCSSVFGQRDEQIKIYQEISFILLFVNMIISLAVAREITKPLNIIVKTVDKIADGDIAVRIPVKKYESDEIDILSKRFNQMADSIQSNMEELENAVKREEEFVGNFAHEIKTPMTSIIGYADFLRSNDLTPEMEFQCANYIYQEGKRLEKLSLRMLDIIVLKKQEIQYENISSKQFFKDIEKSMEPVFRRENIKYQMNIQETKLWVEPVLVKTVIINILDNARKALEDKRKIFIKGWIKDDKYYIEIEDTGKGIPKSQIKNIADAFYMVDKSRSREQGGAGLGLTISSRIVKLHGGKIEFESEPGTGTKVTIILPLEKAEETVYEK